MRPPTSTASRFPSPSRLSPRHSHSPPPAMPAFPLSFAIGHDHPHSRGPVCATNGFVQSTVIGFLFTILTLPVSGQHAQTASNKPNEVILFIKLHGIEPVVVPFCP